MITAVEIFKSNFSILFVKACLFFFAQFRSFFSEGSFNKFIMGLFRDSHCLNKLSFTHFHLDLKEEDTKINIPNTKDVCC